MKLLAQGSTIQQVTGMFGGKRGVKGIGLLVTHGIEEPL